MAKKRALTGKQRAFVDYYIQTGNGVKSAELAGYKGTYGVLGTTAHDNLKKPNIKAAIDKVYAERAMGRDEVLARLADIARGNAKEYLTEDHGIVILDVAKMLKDGNSHLIKKYSVTKSGTFVELYDAQKALETIGRHHALFTDNVAVTFAPWKEDLLKALQASDITLDEILAMYDSDLLGASFFKQANAIIANK